MMLQNLPPDTPFHEDGAPPHYRREIRVLLDEELQDLWIGGGGPTN